MCLRRFTICVLLFFGLFMTYLLKITINSMSVNSTSSLVNNAYFYGSILSPIPGGYLAYLYGGKYVFIGSIGTSSLLILISSKCAEFSQWIIFVFRLIMGIDQGIIIPAFYAISAKWGPPLERGLLVTTTLAGSYFGIVINEPLTSFLSELGFNYYAYVFGALGVIFCVVFYFLLSESPVNDKFVSSNEAGYLQNSLGILCNLKPESQPPWGSIFKSLPVWALVSCYFAYSLGVYIILTELGFNNEYGDSIFHLTITSNFSRCLPYIIMIIAAAPIGWLSDFILLKKFFHITYLRKGYICISLIIQVIGLIISPLWQSEISNWLCMVLVIGLGVFAWSGMSVNHYDLCPQYACITVGICTTFTGLSIVVVPKLFEKLPTFSSWYLSASAMKSYIIVFFYILAIILFGIFGSGLRQPWVADSIPLVVEAPKKTYRFIWC